MADRALTVSLSQRAPIPLDVTLTCGPGQVLALFGPSGSGKTTILRSIAGLYSPREGRVIVGSETWLDTAAGIDMPAHGRHAGFVFQDYALFPHLTALGNVMLPLHHLSRDARRARAMELLQLMHLQDRRDSLPAQLSGGERQRVAVARALAREPRVLLLDEPFAAIDSRLRRALHAELIAIRRAFDIPIVLVTHDFEDVVRLATDVAIIESGQVMASGPVGEMTSRADLPGLGDISGRGAVIDARVDRIDDHRGLAELRFGGQLLVAPARGLVPGGAVRVRIPAREVILATVVPLGLSLHNILPATVSGIHVDAESAQSVLQLRVGDARILAEVTQDAVSRLGLAEGTPVHALIKSVSLDVGPAV